MNPQDYLDSSSGKATRTLQGYWAFLPSPLPPDLSWSPPLIKSLSEAERNLSRLAGMSGSLGNLYRLAMPFVRREAVLSSRIEGTQASLTDLYHFETAQLSFWEAAPDVREVHNYVRALDFGLERLKTLPVSLRLIREIHKVLLEGVRGEHLTPGEFRLSQNWIGPPGSTISTAPYVPPPVEQMHACLDHLEKFVHAASDLPGLIRAGLIHHQFEAIHPFLDGNGRIGRLLAVLLLCEWDLLPEPLLILSGYLEANREAYYDRLLAVSRTGAWEEWLSFFLEGVSSESRMSVARLQRLGELWETYRERLRAGRAGERLSQALEYLFGRPILSVRQLEAGLGIPYRTAMRYIEKLVQAGILREATGRKRGRIYQADEILYAIEGPVNAGEPAS